MNDNYAFAVSRIRALEKDLLTKQQISRLIDCPDDFSVLEMLSSYGWTIPKIPFDYDKFLSDRLSSVFEELKNLTKNSDEFKLIASRNDFQNLKTALKVLISSSDNNDLFVYPTNIDVDALSEVIKNQEFHELPNYLQDVAKQAYSLVTSSADGQLLDTYIDVETLKHLNLAVRRLNNEILTKYVTVLTDLTDIKTAYRCALTKKDYNFALSAVLGSENLPKETLAKFASKGTVQLLDYLKETVYSEFAEYLSSSTLKFENEFENLLFSVFEGSMYDSFGINHLLAYYMSAENEIKAVRVILTCKRIKADKQEINERMHNPYV